MCTFLSSRLLAFLQYGLTVEIKLAGNTSGAFYNIVEALLFVLINQLIGVRFHDF